MPHPADYLITCCGNPAQIDVELVPVCKAIWSHGIHTQWTCQGDGDGVAVLAFPDIGEADRFAQLVFDLGRPWAQQQRGEPVQEPPPITGWRMELGAFRLPLTQRAHVAFRIPRKDLPGLTQWLQGTPSRTLEHHPVAGPCDIDAHAGQPMSAEDAVPWQEIFDAFEVLEALDDDGTCCCEPGEIDHEDGCGFDQTGDCECDHDSDHGADCPRNYDHLTTAEEIAKFREYIKSWSTSNPTGEYIARLARVGITAREIELREQVKGGRA